MVDLPTGRLHRLARLAAFGARATAGSLTGTDHDGKRIARAAVDALGSMRGLALKIGQMASYVDGYVPEGYRDAFETTLRTLRDAAPAMAAEEAARVVRAELGDAPDRLFAEWSPTPFAAASIGQVHRARLFDGRLVAVKVQYEQVAKAVASDLSNASMLSSFLGPLASKFGVHEQMKEMRARFGEELDYAHEALQQERFTRVSADHATIRIPHVIHERSRRRVLTTEMASGQSFEEACAAPPAARALWAATMWRFVFGSLLQHGLFNADPHPGNYLFAPDGVVWFLDFGCTRALAPERVALCVAAHRAAAVGDETALFAAFDDLLGTPPGDQRRRIRSYVRACFAPVLTPGPYRITREYTTALWDELVVHAVGMARGSRKEFAPMPADLLFLNRLQFGFYSVLARLDVAVDYHAIEADILRP